MCRHLCAWVSGEVSRRYRFFTSMSTNFLLYRGADPNTNDAIVLSGTSMASPIVSGIAAALWSRSPQLPVAAIRKLVLDSAIPGIVTGITNSSWPNRLANLPSDISSVPLVPDTPDVDKSPVPFVANPRQGNQSINLFTLSVISKGNVLICNQSNLSHKEICLALVFADKYKRTPY